MHQEFTYGWWQLSLQGWHPVPASSLESPRQHLWPKSTSCSPPGSAASCGTPQHPVASCWIPSYLCTACCPVTRAEFIYSFWLCWCRGKVLPSQPALPGSSREWFIQLWPLTEYKYSGNLVLGDGSLLSQCIKASLELERTAERNAECQDLWIHIFIKEMKRKNHLTKVQQHCGIFSSLLMLEKKVNSLHYYSFSPGMHVISSLGPKLFCLPCSAKEKL